MGGTRWFTEIFRASIRTAPTRLQNHKMLAGSVDGTVRLADPKLELRRPSALSK
jgi:hypothetical protein